MRVCIAQTQSIKGEVQPNIQNHLRIIQKAISFKADLVIFPELSITGYEPELADKLSTHLGDAVFNPFQELADKNEITIGVGMPLKTVAGITISMVIFQPNAERTAYAKQLLHADELPYFVCGTSQTLLDIKGKKIALGICYETLQRQHFLQAIELGADIYIASVAKPQGGIEKAYSHFPKMAKEFNTPILLANAIGHCDNFLAVGKSAVWNKQGDLLGELDNNTQRLLIYNADEDAVVEHEIII